MFPSFPCPPPPLIIDVEGYPLSVQEEEELRVVDFVLESKLVDVSVAQLLGRFTYVVDVESAALNKFSFSKFEGDTGILTSSSDSDSDSSASSF